MQKYSVNQHLIDTILAWVNSGEIAIPEIQRPFVWDSSKVRDLMDSLYQGYPIGDGKAYCPGRARDEGYPAIRVGIHGVRTLLAI